MKLHLLVSASLFLLPSCGPEAAPPVEKHDDHAHEEAGHHHEPPNGGTLVELGDHFANLELVLNPKKGELNAWIHDGHATNPIRLPDARIPLGLALADGTRFDLALEPLANVLTGEVAGDTSQFRARDPKLIGLAEFEAFLPPLRIKGQTLGPFRFRFPSGELVATD